MRLSVFGAGYVGLVTGVGLADLGYEVCVLDIDAERIRGLEAGEVPIYEPGLGELLRRNRDSGRLQFATTLPTPFDAADAYFIAVGTPPGPDGAADVSAAFASARQIAERATQSALVVVKSTVPVGTCDSIQQVVSAHARPGVHLEVVSNPEFLKEGAAVSDFFRPERIVLGAHSESARQVLRSLYAPLQLSGERLVFTDPRSSELIKYASNTMLAMRVSFMNELSRLCHATGADIHSVRLAVGSDSRIGKQFLYAGPGYGGSCFPKDVQALYHLGRSYDVPMRLAEATHLANEEQGTFLADLLLAGLGPPRGKTVAFWGLSFKPETDDVREAPSVKLAQRLLQSGARVVGHDPEAGPSFLRAMGGKTDFLDVVARDYDAVDGASVLVVLTEWRTYRAPNFARIKRRMADNALLLDARNIWRPQDVTHAGLRYQGIGVPASGSTAALPPASSRALDGLSPASSSRDRT